MNRCQVITWTNDDPTWPTRLQWVKPTRVIDYAWDMMFQELNYTSIPICFTCQSKLQVLSKCNRLIMTGKHHEISFHNAVPQGDLNSILILKFNAYKVWWICLMSTASNSSSLKNKMAAKLQMITLNCSFIKWKLVCLDCFSFKCAHFCYKMVHSGIWDWCIMRFVQHVYLLKISVLCLD